MLRFAEAYGDMFELTESPEKAAAGADVLVTDVWASMGQEEEKAEREKSFGGYQIDDTLMELANRGAIVLHCPARPPRGGDHRGCV